MANYRDSTHIDKNKEHQITELVKFIREKVYGIDVREAIALALEKVYDDAAKSGNANMEVEMARGIYPNLNERLVAQDRIIATHDKQLSQKANISDLARKRDKSEKIGLNDLTVETLAAIEGGEGTTFNIESVPRDGSVTPIKTSFMKHSRNLFDGTYHPLYVWTVRDENNNPIGIRYRGVVESDTIQPMTAIIPLEPNATYTFKVHEPELSDGLRLGIVNELPDLDDHSQKDADHFIYSGSPNNVVTFTSTSEAKYLLVSVSYEGKKPKCQLEFGDEATDYIEHMLIPRDFIEPKLPKNIVKTENVADKNITINKLSFVKSSRNLFDGIWHPLYVWTAQDPLRIRYRGLVPSDTIAPSTAIIPIQPNETYTLRIIDDDLADFSRVGIANRKPNPDDHTTFDAEVFIHSGNDKQITFTNTQEGRWLIVCVSYEGKKPRMQVELGEQSSDYVEHLIIPSSHLELPEKEEVKEVHTCLDRGQIVPLVFGTEDEEPDISGGVLSYDYENTKIGDRAYKISSVSQTNARLSFDIDTNTGPVTAIGFWAYVPEPEKINEIRVYLHKKTNEEPWHNSNKSFLELSNLKKGWNYLRYPTHRARYNDLDQLNKIEFVVSPLSPPTSVTISKTWLEISHKAKMIFVEDAQFKSFYELAYPDLVARNIPVTWALRIVNLGTDVGGGQLTEEQIAQVAQENNNSVTFHSYGMKPSADMTPEEVRADVAQAQKWLLARGYTGGVFKGAWFQNKSPNHWAAHDYLVTSGTPYSNETLTIWPFVNQYEVPRIGIHSVLSHPGQLEQTFDALKSTRGLAVFYTHGVSTASGDVHPDFWDLFIEKIDEGLGEGWLEPTTFEELNKKYKVYDELKF